MEVTTANAGVVAVGVKNGRVGCDGPSTVRRSASIANIAKAMAAAQAELKNPPKESVNPHFKSKYADLATVRDVVTPVLAKHKLAVMQFPCELDDAPALATILTHESGEWIETTIKLRPSKADPQGVGSALTYMRRYCLQSVCGVAADEDDDANAASKPAQKAQPQHPAGDNLELRDKAEAALRSSGDRARYLSVCAQFNKDAAAGKFSPADLEHLGRVSREVGAKFPEPAGAK